MDTGPITPIPFPIPFMIPVADPNISSDILVCINAKKIGGDICPRKNIRDSRKIAIIFDCMSSIVNDSITAVVEMSAITMIFFLSPVRSLIHDAENIPRADARYGMLAPNVISLIDSPCASTR